MAGVFWDRGGEGMNKLIPYNKEELEIVLEIKDVELPNKPCFNGTKRMILTMEAQQQEIERQKERCNGYMKEYGTAIEIIAEKVEQIQHLQAQVKKAREALIECENWEDEYTIRQCAYCGTHDIKQYGHKDYCPVGQALSFLKAGDKDG
jgi:hypothetical protein